MAEDGAGAAAAVRAAALRRLRQLSSELRELDVGGSVGVLPVPPRAEDFVREYVAANKPVLIRGAASHWPAARAWSRRSLREAAGELEVSVDLTPNGLGDAVTPLGGGGGQGQGQGSGGLCFCTPHKRRMRFAEFLDLFFRGPEGEVPYLQQQNSNLTEEFAPLLADVEPQLGFAAAAFGGPPEAANLWIGDERSTTTFHRDHFENLYAVVRGTKVFHLLPPCEAYRLSMRRYPAARYEPVGGRLVPVLEQPPASVLWCPIHPRGAAVGVAAAGRREAEAEHPLFFDPSLPPPLVVEVAAGDVLYLPAMWYHYVEQRADPDPEQRWCVAVNYWHEMRFDWRYAACRLAEALAEDAGLLPPPLEPEPEPRPGGCKGDGKEEECEGELEERRGASRG